MNPVWLTRNQLDAITGVAWVVSARQRDAVDLRCFGREILVAYLRETQPSALPRLRLAETARDDTPQSRTGNDGATTAERHSGE